MTDVLYPPAFPCETDGNPNGFQSGERLWTYPGMTLRDYFAAQALPAVIAATSAGQHHLKGVGTVDDMLAQAAFSLADAMLRARMTAPEIGG
jgi:hypothetical protein